MPDPAVEVVQEIYDAYVAKPGSEHIATLSSLLNLYKLLAQYKPKMCLDWGAGIGTTASLSLKVSKEARVDVYERNEWCREQLIKNVPHFTGDIFTFAPSGAYDFLIIDDDISRREIRKLLSNGKLRIIFIEGWRNRTVGQFSKRLPFYGFSATYVRSSSHLHLFGRGGGDGRRVALGSFWTTRGLIQLTFILGLRD